MIDGTRRRRRRALLSKLLDIGVVIKVSAELASKAMADLQSGSSISDAIATKASVGLTAAIGRSITVSIKIGTILSRTDACTTGTYSASGAGDCTGHSVATCDLGLSFSPGSASKDSKCTTCSSGRFSAFDDKGACVAHSITICPEGNGLDAGTTQTDGVCTTCPSGRYSGQHDEATCTTFAVTSCPEGSGFVSGSSTKDAACLGCEAGKYSDTVGTTTCASFSLSSCTQGFNFVQGGASKDNACTACAGGRYNPTGGTTSCGAHKYTSCQRGQGFTAGSPTIDSRCTPCTTGTFSANQDQSACALHTKSSCPPGEGFTAGTAQADDAACTACVAGKYSASTDALECASHSTSSCASTHQLMPGSATADDAKCAVLLPVITGYSSGATSVYTRNKRIDENRPIVGSSGGGAPTSYAIDPALPAGLFFSTSTGTISGKTSSVYARTVHHIRGTNAGGTSSAFAVTISVLPVPPKISDYGGGLKSHGGATTISWTKGKEVSRNAPSVSGDDAIWQVSPALPLGLTMSTTTGVITGTPTSLRTNNDAASDGGRSFFEHTVLARNDGGTSQYVLNVRVVDQIPSLLRYDRIRISFDIHGGAAFVENLPELHATSGGTPTSFIVTPALPAGLTFNTVTGAITGNVTDMVPALPMTHYVKALNTGGESTGVSVSIELKDRTTLLPLLASPVSVVGTTLLLDMTLSEAASPGSVTVTFAPVADAPREAKTVILTMGPGWTTKGHHLHTIPSSSALETGGAVTSVFPSSGAALVNGAEYNVKLAYTDTGSNGQAETENKVRIDRTAPRVKGADVQIVDSSASKATVQLTSSDRGQVYWMARTSGNSIAQPTSSFTPDYANLVVQGCPDMSATTTTTMTTTCVSGSFALATSVHGIETLTKSVITGLPSGKQMSVWFAVVDAAGNKASDSDVASTKSAITTAADQIAPVTTINMPLATSETSATVEVDSSEEVAVYMLAVPLVMDATSSGITAPAAPGLSVILGPKSKSIAGNAFDAAAANAFYITCGGPSITEQAVVRGVVAAGAGSSTHSFGGLRSGVSYAVYAAPLDGAVPPNMGSVTATVIKQPDLTAPAFVGGYPKVSTLTETSAEVQLKMDGPGKVHYVVEFDDGTAGGARRRLNAAAAKDKAASENIARGQTALGGAAFLKGTATVDGIDNTGQVLVTGLPRGGVSVLVSMVAEDAEGNLMVPPLVLPAIQFADTSAPEFVNGYPRLASTASDSGGVDRSQAEVEISVEDGLYSKGCTVSWIAILKDPSEAFEKNESQLVPPSTGGQVGLTRVTSQDVRLAFVAGLSVFKSGSVALLSSSSSAVDTSSRPKIGKIVLSSLPEGQDAVVFLVATDESAQQNAMTAPLRYLLDRNTMAPSLTLPSRGHLYGAAGVPIEFTLPEQAMPGSVHLLVTSRGGSRGETANTHRVVFGSSLESAGVHKTILSASSLRLTPVQVMALVTSTLSGRTVPTFEDRSNADVAEIKTSSVSSGSKALVDGVEYDVQLVYQDMSGNPVAQADLLQPSGASSTAGITIKHLAPSLSYTMVQTAMSSTTTSSGPDTMDLDFGSNTGGGSSVATVAALPASATAAAGPGSIGTTLGSAASAASAKGESSSSNIRLTLSGPGSVFWVALRWNAKVPSPANIVRGIGEAGGAALAHGVVDMADAFDFTTLSPLASANIYQALITQVVADIEAPTATAPAKVDRVMPRHDPMGVGISLHLATVDLLGNIGGVAVSIQPATCTVDSLATTLDSNGVVTQPGDLCKSVIGAGSTDEKNTVPVGVGCAIKRLDHKCDVAFCGHDGAWLGGVCASTMVGGISNLATSTSSIIGALDIFNPAKPLSATNVPLGTNLSSVAPILSEQAVERVETAATAILSTAVATAVVSSVVSVTASAVTSAIASGFIAGAAGAATGAASSAAIAGSAIGSAGGAGGAALPLLLTMQTLSMTTKLKVMQAMGEDSTYQRIFSNIEWTNFQFDAFPFTMLVGGQGNESVNGSNVSLSSTSSPDSSWTSAVPASLGAASSSDTASAIAASCFGLVSCVGPKDGNSSFAGDCAWHYNWDPECTRPCGGGMQQGMLQVTRWPSKGGVLCPTLVNAERACNTQKCRTSTVPYAMRCSDVMVAGSESSIKSKAVSLFVNNVFWVTLILTILVIVHLAIVACLRRKHRHHSRKHEEKIKKLPPIGSSGVGVSRSAALVAARAAKSFRLEGKVGDRALSAAEEVRAVHDHHQNLATHHAKLRQKSLSFRVVEKAMPPLALPRLELMLLILTYQGVCLSAFSALDRQMEWYVVCAGIIIAVFPIGLIIFVVIKLRREVVQRRTAVMDPNTQRWVSKQEGSDKHLVRRDSGSRGGSVGGIPSPKKSARKKLRNPLHAAAWGEGGEARQAGTAGCMHGTPAEGEKDEEPTSFHGPLALKGKSLSFHGLDSIDIDGPAIPGTLSRMKKHESFKDKAKRLEMGIVERYGVLFDDFKPQYYLWKPVKFLLQMMTGLLLSGLLPISAVAQSGTLMFVYLFYCVAALVLRPHVHAAKNVFEVVFSLGYALVFFGSIMLIKADCWGIAVSDIEVYMIVVSGLMTVILVLKVVVDGGRKLGWKKLCCIATCGISKKCKRKDDAVISLYDADAARNNSSSTRALDGMDFERANPMHGLADAHERGVMRELMTGADMREHEAELDRSRSCSSSPVGLSTAQRFGGADFEQSNPMGRAQERVIGRHVSSSDGTAGGFAEGKSRREHFVEVRNPSFRRKSPGMEKLMSSAPSESVDDIELSVDTDNALLSAASNAKKVPSPAKGLTSNRRPKIRKLGRLSHKASGMQSRFEANTAREEAERMRSGSPPSYEEETNPLQGASPPAYDDDSMGTEDPSKQSPKVRRSAAEVRRSMSIDELTRGRSSSSFSRDGPRKKQWEPTSAIEGEADLDAMEAAMEAAAAEAIALSISLSVESSMPAATAEISIDDLAHLSLPATAEISIDDLAHLSVPVSPAAQAQRGRAARRARSLSRGKVGGGDRGGPSEADAPEKGSEIGLRRKKKKRPETLQTNASAWLGARSKGEAKGGLGDDAVGLSAVQRFGGADFEQNNPMGRTLGERASSGRKSPKYTEEVNPMRMGSFKAAQRKLSTEDDQGKVRSATAKEADPREDRRTSRMANQLWGQVKAEAHRAGFRRHLSTPAVQKGGEGGEGGEEGDGEEMEVGIAYGIEDDEGGDIGGVLPSMMQFNPMVQAPVMKAKTRPSRRPNTIRPKKKPVGSERSASAHTASRRPVQPAEQAVAGRLARAARKAERQAATVAAGAAAGVAAGASAATLGGGAKRAGGGVGGRTSANVQRPKPKGGHRRPVASPPASQDKNRETAHEPTRRNSARSQSPTVVEEETTTTTNRRRTASRSRSPTARAGSPTVVEEETTTTVTSTTTRIVTHHVGEDEDDEGLTDEDDSYSL